MDTTHCQIYIIGNWIHVRKWLGQFYLNNMNNGVWSITVAALSQFIWTYHFSSNICSIENPLYLKTMETKANTKSETCIKCTVGSLSFGVHLHNTWFLYPVSRVHAEFSIVFQFYPWFYFYVFFFFGANFHRLELFGWVKRKIS